MVLGNLSIHIYLREKQNKPNKQKQNINENKNPLTRGIIYWIFKNLNYKHLRKKQTGNFWWWFLDRPRQAQTSRTTLHWTTKHWITIPLENGKRTWCSILQITRDIYDSLTKQAKTDLKEQEKCCLKKQNSWIGCL